MQTAPTRPRTFKRFATVITAFAVVGVLVSAFFYVQGLSANTTYYSKASLPPELVTSWSSTRDGLGVPPANFAGASDSFVIQNTHNMTTLAAWIISGTSSKVQIESGGTLTANHAVTIASTGTFQIDGGGTYIHNNNTLSPTFTIFQGVESFATTSTFEIRNFTTAAIPVVTGGFGNLTINAPTLPQTWNQTSNLTSVKGNLTVQATGGGTLEFRLANATDYTLNIGGNLTISGGILNISNGSSAAKVINIGGNFSQSGGTFTSGTGQTAVNFSGGTSFVSFSQTAGTLTPTNINWSIANGKTVQFDHAFTNAASRTFNVNTGGMLLAAATITNSGTLNVNGEFRLTDGGFADGNDFVYGANGILGFTTAGGYGVNAGHDYWPTTNGPQNVTVLSGGITMNTARTVGGLFQYSSGVSNAGNLTLNGTSQVNAGGFTSGSPTYGASSLLKYNTGGTYGRNGEWLPNATGGAGYPANVQLSNSTTLDLANASTTQPFEMSGSLTVDNGSKLQMAGATPLTQALNVKGGVTLNGNLELSSAIGGDLKVGGNYFASATGLTPNNRAIFFNGAAAQTISGNGSFDYLIIQNTAAPVANAAGVAINIAQQLQLPAGATFNVLSSTLTFLPGSSLSNAGAVNTGTTRVQSSVNLSGVHIASGLVMQPGGSVVTTGPTYNVGSILYYETGGTTSPGAEWSTSSGAGAPSDIEVRPATTVDLGGNGHAALPHYVGRTLYIHGTAAVTLAGPTPATAPLNVAFAVNIQAGGSLALSTAAGGDINIGQFWAQAGTFTPNGRTVTFNGTAAASISGAATFAPYHLTINNAAGVTATSPVTVAGTLALANGAFANGTHLTLANGSTVERTGGSLAATPALGGTVNLSYPGAANITAGPEMPASTTALGNLSVGGAGGLNLAADSTVNSQLTLAGGNLDAGAFTLTLGPSASVARTSGHVLGNLKHVFNSSGSKTFDVGTANGYSPVAAGVTAGTGDLTVRAVQGQQPGVPGPNALQRYWSLAGSGVTTDLTFHYLAADVAVVAPVTEADYKVLKRAGAVNTIPANQSVNAGAHTATVGGVSSFSDWTLVAAAATFGEIKFAQNNTDAAETNSGTHDVQIAVSRAGGSAGTVSVDYAVTDGTATTADNDYAVASATGTLTWNDGDAADKTITVTVNGDTAYEPDEAVNLAITNPQGGAALGTPDTSTLTITNDDARPAPNVVYVDDDFNGPAGSDPAGPAAEIGYDAFQTIQGGVNGVANGGTVNVAAGTYDEDVNVNKTLGLLGAGSGVTNVRGIVGGSATTIQITASNVTVAGFTVTRLGNNTTDWNNPGLNGAGFAIQGQAVTGALIRDNVITGNRTGIDINNSNGHTVRNNIVDSNRTGLLYRNQTDSQTVVENFITNNWTVGVLFIDASGGTNAPVQSALHSTFSNNNISGNWYGQIVDRQSGGSLPAPGTTNLKNFRHNWFGTTSPVVTTANSAEPGYAAQIPVAYGGSATPPGGQPDIAGSASANFRYTPFLLSGTDTNVETTPGRGTFGFQGAQANVLVWPVNQQGWVFFDDSPGTGTGTGGFEHGPATPPLGVGSAFLTVDGQGRHAFGTGGYGGTRMDDVTALGYSSYQDNNANTVVAPSLQFDIDYDLNDAATAYAGRLAFEPYLSPTQGAVQQNVWQNWDALAGNWYGTRTSVTVNNVSVAQPCQPATPCTWQQVIALFPNAGVRAAPTSAVLFKVGGPWSPGFDGNVDDFRIAVGTAQTTYDFEPLPQLSINDVTLAEGDAGQTAYTFTVTLSRAVDATVTVDYATADGSAAAPSDYASLPTAQLVFNPGDTSKQFAVQVNGDAAFEPAENFFVNLSNPSNATLLDAQGAGTITNDDAAQNGTLQFGAAAYTVNEGVASATITVTRTGGADEAAAVTYATSDGTAAAGDDYASASGTLNWAAGDSAPKTFAVAVTNDAADEPNETVVLTLSNATGAILGTPNPATLNIIDNDGAASTNVVVVYPTALQGWDSFNQATAAGAFVTGPCTPIYGSGSYQMTTGAGTGGAGAGGKHWLKTNAYNGTRLDAISHLSYRTYVDTTSTATDNLAPVLEMMVDADGNGTRDTTLVFEPVYTPEQGAVQKDVWQTWNARAGRWRSTATVGPIVPDTYFPLDTFFAAHPNATVVQWYPRADGFGFGASVGQNTGGGWAGFVGAVDGVEFGVNNASTLNDFELAPPTVSINDVTLAEGDAGTTSFDFGVTLSGASSVAVTVDFTTQDGTATIAGGDYAANSNTLNFVAGETTKTVTVLVNGDTAYEANENFNVQLSNPTGGAGATIADADGAGAITNDDAAVSGSIEFVSPTYTVSETGGPAQITVQRTGGTDGEATATFSTSDGTATAAEDYTAVAGQSVTFAHGEGGMKTIDVPVLNDALYEGDETVNLSLTVTSITLVRNVAVTPQAVLTITDDEAVPTVTVSSPVYTSEPETGTAGATFTFTLSGPAAAPVTLDYQTQDGTATAPDDYTAIPVTELSFAASQTTRTVTVDVKADAASEGAEQYTLALSNVSANATLAATSATGHITDFVPAGGLLISELRLRGAAGSADEFVELYNNTNSAITVGTSDGSDGWALAALSADGLSELALHVIPAGTVIPARSYYLVANDPSVGTSPASTSLAGYSLGAHAAPDASYSVDVSDASGVAVFRTSDTAGFSLSTRLDAAGFTAAAGALPELFREGAALASPGANDGEYAFFRTLTSGRPADTDDNAADFTFVSTDAGSYGGVQSVLGAPGPQNAVSPLVRTNVVKGSLVDPGCAGTTSAPLNGCARYRDQTPDPSNNSTNGTLSIRRKFVNNTGESITRLRFRVVDATVGAAPAGTADMRLRTSPTFMAVLTGVGGTAQIEGLTLESPPAQAEGGGLNSTVAAGSVALATPLAAGNSINVHFLLGIEQTGTFRFLVNVEALKMSEEPAAAAAPLNGEAARRKSPRPAPKK